MSSRRIVLVDIGEGLTLSGILPSVALNDGYSARLIARGGVAPYTYAIVGGALPDGLMLDAATGVISGTASAAGAFGFTARVTDISGATARKSFAIQVAQPVAPPLVISGTYPNGTVGVAYSADLTISGGVTPYSNARVVSGALPDGLALSIVGNKLRLSGTPTTSATSNFTLAVDDGGGKTAQSVQNIIMAPAAASDPYWSNVDTLLRFNGSNGSTTFTNEKSRNWSPLGSSVISTAQSKFGGSSGSFQNPTDSIVSSDGNPLTQGRKWTIDFWLYPIMMTGNHAIFRDKFRGVYLNNGKVGWYIGSSGGEPISVVANDWNYLMITCDGTYVRLSLAGVFSSNITTQGSYSSGNIYIGGDIYGQGLAGYLDDFRLTLDIVRQAGNFSPPTQQAPNQ